MVGHGTLGRPGFLNSFDTRRSVDLVAQESIFVTVALDVRGLSVRLAWGSRWRAIYECRIVFALFYFYLALSGYGPLTHIWFVASLPFVVIIDLAC